MASWRKPIFAEFEAVVEGIVVGYPVRRAVRPGWVLDKNPRLKARAVPLADPGDLELGFAVGHVESLAARFLLCCGEADIVDESLHVLVHKSIRSLLSQRFLMS
ncbi:MAG: hypothetical protein HY897_05830 [Deltaproteobacteria bacterium]|nr:hypothetical protein [Deltaproteobacteria bacterium]